MAESFFDRHLVWWSSRESIETGKTSLLAVAEVIFSVAAYWWIAWYFDTYAYLLISVLVAPLVLLRSDESVALGVEMYSRYWNAVGFPLRSAKGVPLVIVSAVAAGGAYWLAADWFLVAHEGWPGFWGTTLIGIFALNVGFAVATAVMGAGMKVRAEAEVKARRLKVAVVIALLGPGLGVGILIRAVATRLFASLRHIHRGAAAFPKNWRHTLFQIDLRCAPELVPGIGEEEPKLDFGRTFKNFRSETDPARKFLDAILLPILFIPSLLYRYSIKSTCWLYLPLIYVAHLPGWLRDEEKRKAWLKGHSRKVQNWASLFGAVIALLAAALAYTDYKALTDLVGAVQRGNLQATPLAYLLVLDVSDLPIWHRFSLPAAVLTVGLFFALNSLAVDLQTGAKDDVSGLRVRALIWLSRLRNLLVFWWVVITVYYFAEYAYGRCPFDDWMAPLLEWRFGPPPTCSAPGT